MLAAGPLRGTNGRQAFAHARVDGRKGEGRHRPVTEGPSKRQRRVSQASPQAGVKLAHWDRMKGEACE